MCLDRSRRRPALVDSSRTQVAAIVASCSSRGIGPRNLLILRAPDEPSSDTVLCRGCRKKIRCARGPCLAHTVELLHSVPGALWLATLARAPPAEERSPLFARFRACRALRSVGAFHRVSPALRRRARAFPMGVAVFGRSGFALDRLSPIHRSAALRQRSPTTLLPPPLDGALLKLPSLKVSRRALWLSQRPSRGARCSAPCGSRALFPRAVVTCSRASSRLARARSRVGRERRRRARSVPTDVYNPRDLFSTTSTFVSADSDPLCPPGLLLGFLPRDASRRGQPTRLGSDRSHADHSLGRSIGPHTILSIAFVPRGRGPWHPSPRFAPQTYVASCAPA